MNNKNKTISFRLSEDLRQRIEEHIKTYGFKNISEFILYTIEKELYKK